ncbi:MAG: AEC family transporter [Gammaproteobacteria bacterium]|nr:AEC family transporter [Gammaproteobacteria bacterium]
MLAIVSITTPIFLLIALGYLAVRWRILPYEAIPGLGRFVLYFAMPGLILHTLSSMEFDQVLDFSFIFAYGLGSLLMLGLGLLISLKVFKNEPVLASLKAMGVSMSNTPYFGFPVLLQVVGGTAAQAFSMALLVETILIIPLCIALLEYNSSRGTGTSLGRVLIDLHKRMLSNPLLIAIIAGMLISALDVSLPDPINITLEMLGRSSATIALFMIGASLVDSPMRGKLGGIAPMLLGKLIAHPLMVALLIWLLPPFNPDLQLAAVLLAAMPMMSIYPIFGSQYGYRNFATSTLMLATICAFFTISAILIFIQA